MQVWNGIHNPQWTRLERHMESCLLQFGSNRNERMPERKSHTSNGRFHDLPVDGILQKQYQQYACLSYYSYPFQKHLFHFKGRNEYGKCLFFFIFVNHNTPTLFTRHRCLFFKRIHLLTRREPVQKKVYSMPILAKFTLQYLPSMLRKSRTEQTIIRYYIVHLIEMA